MAKARKKAAPAAEVTQPTVTESTTNTQPAGEVTPAEREAAHENGHQHTAANENGHAARHQQHREPGQSHADAVGQRPQRQPGYTDGFRDRVIGAHRLEHHYPFLSIIRFEEKPSEQVRKKLHDEGFTWEQRNMEWKRPINYDTRQQDKASARRVFDEVCQMIRTERGINHGYGGHSAA